MLIEYLFISQERNITIFWPQYHDLNILNLTVSEDNWLSVMKDSLPWNHRPKKGLKTYL